MMSQSRHNSFCSASVAALTPQDQRTHTRRNDNIYNSANPEFKTVNLGPARATRACMLGFRKREETHLGEAEGLRVRPREEVRGPARIPAGIVHKETPPSSIEREARTWGADGCRKAGATTRTHF